MKTTVAVAAIAIAALAAYRNTFGVPFVFDDGPAIVENPGIRRLWPLWDAFRAQAPASTVDGRPVANFSLALNYALSGTHVWSYHALNLLIHLGAGLALFGVIRRTLVIVGRHRRMPPVSNSAGYGDPALQREGTFLAFAIALLWTLHPLQTEAVTYVVQRVESLMGLFYLLTLYAFIRGVDGGWRARGAGRREQGEGENMGDGSGNHPASLPLAPCTLPQPSATPWFTLSFLCCLLGVGTKEVMVTAPVLVFLYDRTFVAGTFRDAWLRRWKFHLALASTWLPLAALVAGTGWNRGGGAGFVAGVAPAAYWLTQFDAIVRYLALTVWPYPQVFDYGTFWYSSLAAVWWQALIVATLLTLTVVFLFKKPAAGFLGAWFFGILAVTSVVPGTIQMIVEHRMYLPLAAVIAAFVLGIDALLRRCSRPGSPVVASPRSLTPAFPASLIPSLPHSLILLPALALGLLTYHRNATYRTDIALWADTVAKVPNSPRARNALAFAYDRAGRTGDAIREFVAALRLAPDNAELHDNLGVTLAGAGRTAGAIAEFETALRLRPDFPVAHNNLGNALVQGGNLAGAIRHYEEAVRLKPDYAEAHYDLAGALDQSGRTAEALEHLETSIRLKPDSASAHYNLGDVLDRLGRTAEAKAQYEQALGLDPTMAKAQAGLGVILCRSGQMEPGLARLLEAVRLDPGYVPGRFNLGVALLTSGRAAEAAAQFEAVLRLRPDYVPARRALEQIRARATPGAASGF